MMRIYSLSLSFALLVGVPFCVGASSVVHQELNSVESLNLVVLVPLYEPVPGMEPEELKKQIAEITTKTLSRYALNLKSCSRLDLIVEILYASGPPGSNVDTGLVTVKLREDAVLVRSQDAEATTITTWETERLFTSSARQFLERLLEAVSLALDEFGGEVWAAN